MENNMGNTLEIEQALLSDIMQISDPNSDMISKVLSMIKESAFSTLQHRIIYRSIKAIASRGDMIDLITIDSECKRHEQYHDDFFVYLAQTKKATFSSANIMAHARIMREASIERFAIQKLNDAMGMFKDTTNGDVYQRLGLAETMISEISNMSMRNEKGGLKHITEASLEWMDNIDAIHNDGFDKNKFTTGIESLDEVIGVKGMRRGSLVAVGARPKMGKSALMSLIANHFALDLNEVVAMFSMEMPSVEIFERSMTNRTMLNPAEFYRREMTGECKGRMDTAYNEIMNSKLYVEDTPALKIGHIQKESRRLRCEHGSIGLICVDYLTLMEAEKADRNDLAYGMITKSLKNLAKELNCVVLMLTQLNRGLESRPDKRPMPSDSKDTGQIEQDVDLWLGLYKDSVYNEDAYAPGLTEVIARLNRHGSVGTGFVDMREGFHVPLSTEEGAKILLSRQANTSDKENQASERVTFKRK